MLLVINSRTLPYFTLSIAAFDRAETLIGYNQTMPTIYFATTNPQKLQIGQAICAQYGYDVEPVTLDIDEVQGEDAEYIIKDKARRAYELFGKPVVVSDDSWGIRALRGFPGAYMKSMNHWFSSEDFLHLMNGRDDRRITLYQYLAYNDGKNIEVFCNEIDGTIVDSPRGSSDVPPISQIVALDQDNGKTIGEVFEQDDHTFADRYITRREVWHKLMDWYTKK